MDEQINNQTNEQTNEQLTNNQTNMSNKLDELIHLALRKKYLVKCIFNEYQKILDDNSDKQKPIRGISRVLVEHLRSLRDNVTDENTEYIFTGIVSSFSSHGIDSDSVQHYINQISDLNDILVIENLIKYHEA